jgi:hypothetical protein
MIAAAGGVFFIGLFLLGFICAAYAIWYLFLKK